MCSCAQQLISLNFSGCKFPKKPLLELQVSQICGLTLQITAEQILREARELQEQDFKAPKQKITDETELAEYRLRKRKEFEDLVRRVRWNSSVWVKVGRGPLPWKTN